MSQEAEKPSLSHEIFVVAGDNDAARWIRVGAAFANRDGKGFNLVLDALPARDGRLVMRVPSQKSQGDADDTTAKPPRQSALHPAP